MKMIKTMLVACAALFGAVQAWGDSDNLVVNGDFEIATPTGASEYANVDNGATASGWTISRLSGISRAPDGEYVYPRSFPNGSTSALILEGMWCSPSWEYPSELGTAEQTVTTGSGRYRFTFMAKVDVDDYEHRQTSKLYPRLTVTIDGVEQYERNCSYYESYKDPSDWFSITNEIEKVGGQWKPQPSILT